MMCLRRAPGCRLHLLGPRYAGLPPHLCFGNASAGCGDSEHTIMKRIGEALSAEELWTVLEEDVPNHSFNILHASAAFAKLAKQRRGSFRREMAMSAAGLALAEKTQALLSRKQGGHERELCSITWAVARLRSEAAPLRAALLPVIMDNFPVEARRLNSLDVSNVFWAVATLRHDSPELRRLVTVLVQHGLIRANTMAAQAVANVVWALGVLGADSFEADRLLEALCRRAAQRTCDFKPQELANMCWGLALRGKRDEGLMVSVAEVIMWKAQSMSDKSADLDLPQLALAFAKLEIRHPQLMDAVAKRTSVILRKMNPWGLCALAWSCKRVAAMGHVPGTESFRSQLADELADRCFTPDDVQRSQLGPEVWEDG